MDKLQFEVNMRVLFHSFSTIEMRFACKRPMDGLVTYSGNSPRYFAAKSLHSTKPPGVSYNENHHAMLRPHHL